MNIRQKLIEYTWRDQKARLLSGIFLALAGSLLLIVLPWLFKVAVEALGRHGWLFLAGIGLAIIATHLLASGLALGARWLILDATKEAIRRLRNDLLCDLLFTSRTRYSGLDRARVHSRIIDDTERLDVMLNAVAANLLPAGLAAFLLLLLLLKLSCGLTVLLLSTVPLFVLLTRQTRRRLKRYVRDFNDSFEAFSRGVRFLLDMYELTLHQNARDVEWEKQLDNTEKLKGSSRAMALMTTFYSLSQEMVMILATVIVLLGGGFAVSRGWLDLGGLASFYIAVMILKSQFRTFVAALPQCLVGLESLHRLEELGSRHHENFYRGRRKIILQDSIRGENLTFAYPGKEPVIDDLSFLVQVDAITGFKGPNGSGKTTLLNLIYGVLHPLSGGLQADDIPYPELDLDHLRGQVALVSQTPLFFDGSIRENLCYGLEKISEDKLQEILEWCSAGQWISTLNQGIDTRIGENGIELSGGQRQALAISRALLREPRLLLLDEPSSHLDPGITLRLLEKLKAERTDTGIVIVSHDELVLNLCDTVVRLDRNAGERKN